jgi:predicted O-linked N-acetylglucosamine transferase (SPINDLY family)
MCAHAVSPEIDASDLLPLLEQAVEHEQAGRLLEAGTLYQSILQIRPDHPVANHNLGVIAIQAGQAEAGLPHLAAALDADPARGQYWLSYVDGLFSAGHYEDARAVLILARQQGLEGDAVDALSALIQADEAASGAPSDESPTAAEMEAIVASFGEGRYQDVLMRAQRMTARFPGHEFAWKILGVTFKLLGRGADAVEPMQRAAVLAPGDVETHYNLGVTLQELGRLDEAEASYRRALELDPAYSDALLNLGGTLMRLQRLEEAEDTLRAVLLGDPERAAAHSNLGSVLLEQGRLDEAEAALSQALQLDPDNAGVHDNLGLALYRLHRLEEAEAQFRAALRLDPERAGVHTSLGVALQEQGRLDEADAHFQIAQQIDSEDARAHERRGSIHYIRGRLPEAEACFRRALQIVPDEAGIHTNLGKLLRHLKRFDEAEASLRRSLEIRPDDIDTLNNLALTLMDKGALGEAERWFRRVLAKSPDNPGVIGNLGQLLASLGRVGDAEACFRRAQQLLPDDAALHSNLLYFLTLNDLLDAEGLFAEHLRFAERFEPAAAVAPATPTRDRDPMRRLHVGFVSADLNNHAVSSFIEPVVAALSCDPRFTLHAYYTSLVNDGTTKRLREHFTHWHAVATLSDAELTDAIRADGIDILIDLSGHTAGNRLSVFARKPAPVQASWMGYPGTTGLHSMDYYLADRFFLPPGEFDGQFTEKIVRLPAGSAFLPLNGLPEVNRLPALGNGHVTFGSFNRPNKLSPSVIALWARLLRELPDSRMLLGGMPEKGDCIALIGWFEEEAVTRDRLSFCPRCGMDAYLALHHQVDICLDTFPYNGGTTTLHALSMGVPTLSLAGRTAAGRSGATILGHAGLESFIAHDAADFLGKGLFWSGRLDALSDIRAGLRERFAKSPMGRPDMIAAGMACALRTMWKRWCAGLPAEAFEVSVQDIGGKISEARS